MRKKWFKRITAFSLSVLISLSLTPDVIFAAENNIEIEAEAEEGEIQTEELLEEEIEVNSSPVDAAECEAEEEPSTDYDMPSDYGFEPYEETFSAVTYEAERPNYGAGALPSAYNSTGVDTIALSDMPYLREQYSETCWAHASMALAEISLIKQGLVTPATSIDLSELHLAYFAYNSIVDPLGGTTGDSNKMKARSGVTKVTENGGNVINAENVLANWVGAVDESLVPEDDAATQTKVNSTGLTSSLAYGNNYAILTDYYNVNIKTNPEIVKQNIIDNGASTISIYSCSSSQLPTYYNSTNNAYYYNGTALSNHEIVIVGWNDDYPISNFTVPPEGKGAWLCRNSWIKEDSTTADADKYSLNGYFWISYYDRGIDENSTSFKFALNGLYDHNYQYDGGAHTGGMSNSSGDPSKIKYANVFTIAGASTDKELLESVSFATLNTEVTYNINVYMFESGDDSYKTNPESGVKIATATGFAQTEGYYTIPLSAPPVLDKGMRIAVVVESSIASGKVYAAHERNVTNSSYYTSSTKVSSGQSYLCDAVSGDWYDIYGTSITQYGSNFRIKAFTSDYVANPSATDPTDFSFNGDISKDGVELLKGETYQSGVTFVPGSTTATVTYTSSNPTVATVDASGKVTAIGVGTATISGLIQTVSNTRPVYRSFIVRVADISIDDIEALVLEETGSKQVKYKISLWPNCKYTTGTWAVTDSNVATINASGVITPKAIGWTDIKLKVGNFEVVKRIYVINKIAEPTVTVDETGEATISFVMPANTKRVELSDATDADNIRAITTVMPVANTTKYTGKDTNYKDQDIASVKYRVTWVFEYNSAEFTYSIDLATYAGQQAKIYYYIKKNDVYGGASPAVLATVNTEYTLTTPTVDTGYSFGGWYTDTLLTDKAASSYTIEKPVYNFYGAMTPIQYTVNFDGNGADGGTVANMHANYDETITLPTNTYSRVGHTFKEWNTKADGTGTAYQEGDSVSNLTDVANSTVKLYAIWTVDTYTITYNLDGGTNNANNPTSFSGNSPRFTLYPASKPGYSFQCWTDGADNVISYITPVNAKNLVLYAKYIPNKYTFLFDGNGAEAGYMDPVRVNYGDNYTMPDSSFNRIGCTFREWNTKADGTGTTYTKGQVVSNVTDQANKEITLYAIWDGTVYSIGYVIDGDVTNPNPASYNCASGTYTLQKPSRTGYTFVNWTDASNSNKVIREITASNANGLVLKANWEINKYYINFLANGASMGGMNLIEVEYNQTITLPDCGYVWPGHTFSCYKTKPADGSPQAVYNPGDSVTNLSMQNGAYINLYLYWNTSTYTITYDLDGGTNNPGNPATFTGDSSSFSLLTPTKTGYIFEGWFDQNEKPVTQITISNADGLTLKAVWTPITYHLNYYLSGTLMKTQSVKYDETTKLSEGLVPNDNFVFVEWNDDAQGAGTAYAAEDELVLNLTTVANKSINLYAIVKLDYYFITYELDEGENSENNPARIKMAGAEITLEPATKTGYLFEKWTDAEGQTVTKVESSIGKDITLTAVFKPIEYTISYNANTGDGTMAAQTAKYDEDNTFATCTFTKSGKAFLSWNILSDGTGTSFEAGESFKNLTSVDGDTITLYAQWQNSLFDIQYKLNGGTNNSDNPAVYDGANGDYILKEATKTGYNFVSWTDVDGNKVTKITMKNALGLTLYANYSPIRFGIIYYGNGTTGEVTRWFDYDLEAKIAECVFAREGYTFSQWNTAANGTGTTYTPGQDIKNLYDTDQVRPLALYAIWSSNDGTDDGIEDGGGGGANTPGGGQVVDENAAITITAIPDQPYTGKAIKPEVEVKYGETVLEAGKDYIVSYINNVKAGTAKAVVNGRGNFKGTISKEFTITPISIQAELDALLDYSVIYTAKKAQSPVFTLTYEGKKLTLNKEYKLSWTNESGKANKGCVAAGTYPVTIEGIGNYSGTVTKDFIVAADKIAMSKASIKAIPNQKYADYYDVATGTMTCEPEPEVSLKGIGALEKDTDYIVHWSNNTQAGTATLTIEGIGAFAGTKSVNFKIAGTSIAKAKFEGLEKSYPYTGNAIEPEVLVKVGENYLDSSDYDISYTKNINVGKGLITITGKGAYSGTAKAQFTIVGYNFADPDARLVVNYAGSVKYAKNGARPEPTITFDGTALTAGKDYTLLYYNNNKIADALSVDSKGNFNGPYILITGRGNFRGKYENCYFTIVEQSIGLVDVTVSDRVYSKKASNYTITPVLTDLNGKKLVAGKDYEKTFTYVSGGKTLTKTDIVEAGKAVSVTITGKGNYSGTVTKTFRMVSYDINKATVVVDKMSYTGNAIRPNASNIKITIKQGKKTVTLSSSDYEIVGYTNNVAKGTGTVTIHGLGSYGGYKTVKFSIDAKSMK